MIQVGENDDFGARRLKYVRVSVEVLSHLLKADGSFVHEVEGVPADARVVNVAHDYATNELVLTLESNDFPPVKVGDHMGAVNATIAFRKTDDLVREKIQTVLEGMR